MFSNHGRKSRESAASGFSHEFSSLWFKGVELTAAFLCKVQKRLNSSQLFIIWMVHLKNPENWVYSENLEQFVMQQFCRSGPLELR